MSDLIKEYKYKLFVDGEPSHTGDKHSVGIIFNNLTGKNFNGENPVQAFKEWIAYMESFYGDRLDPLMEVHMRDPDGTLLKSGFIGNELQREDPEVGKKYLVKIYPHGAKPFWVGTTFSSHQAATPVSRELFFFSGPSGTYPVERDALLDRVVPVGFLQ